MKRIGLIIKSFFLASHRIYFYMNYDAIKSQLTTGVAPQKIRFAHILHDVKIILENPIDEQMTDFNTLHLFLAQHYQLSKEALLLQGVRRAYRQIVEGV